MNSKNTKYIKGSLEREGMGEVAYFFKKANQNIAYATDALDGIEFSDAAKSVKSVASKINEIRRLANDIVAEIDAASVQIVEAIEKKEEAKAEKPKAPEYTYGVPKNR
jgi:hypothetical protein